MVIKLYISGISGNKEVKKKQQRVQMILDSKQISYEAIDITEPGKEKDKEFMQQNGKVRESLGKYPLPPQIFNDDSFCGDYEDFDMANEVDELEKFLHIETSSKDNGTDPKQNQEITSNSDLKQSSDNSLYNPYDYHTFKIKLNCVNGLNEQIINSDYLAEEKEQTEDLIKSEVNGESKAEITLDPTSENIIEKVEPSAEFIAPDNEESSIEENKANDESGEKKDERSVDDILENKVEGEDTENDEKAKSVENQNDDQAEYSSEVKSPSIEEKMVPDDNKGEEEIESEKEENESEEESAQSEMRSVGRLKRRIRLDII